MSADACGIDGGYQRLAEWVNQHAGLFFGPNRQREFQQALRRLLGRDPTPADLTWFQQDGAALDGLLAAITVGETYFFRDPAQFDFVAREVLPRLIGGRAPGAAVRLWSAGCATGEEAYSLAMVCAREGLGDEAQILGTDLSRAAIETARAGIYRRWSVRLPESAAAEPYLRPSATGMSVIEPLRRRVTFRPLNLAGDVYPPFEAGASGFDLVLCRNVLIYLDGDTVGRVARRLHDTLAPGGWLLTAPSDPPLGELAPFDTIIDQAGIFYRRRCAADAGQRSAPTAPTPSTVTGAGHPPSRAAARRPARAAGRRRPRHAITRGTTAAPPPLTAEHYYLGALALAEAGDLEGGVRAVRRALYLDRTLGMAHFTLGTLLRQIGDRDGARRAYTRALERCLEHAPAAALPLGDGTSAGYLAELARRQLALLAAGDQEVTP